MSIIVFLSSVDHHIDIDLSLFLMLFFCLLFIFACFFFSSPTRVASRDFSHDCLQLHEFSTGSRLDFVNCNERHPVSCFIVACCATTVGNTARHSTPFAGRGRTSLTMNVDHTIYAPEYSEPYSVSSWWISGATKCGFIHAPGSATR